MAVFLPGLVPSCNPQATCAGRARHEHCCGQQLSSSRPGNMGRDLTQPNKATRAGSPHQRAQQCGGLGMMPQSSALVSKDPERSWRRQKDSAMRGSPALPRGDHKAVLASGLGCGQTPAASPPQVTGNRVKGHRGTLGMAVTQLSLLLCQELLLRTIAVLLTSSESNENSHKKGRMRPLACPLTSDTFSAKGFCNCEVQLREIPGYRELGPQTF